MCFRVRRDCRHQTIRTPRHFKRKYITCLFSSCQRRCSRQRGKRGQFCTSSLTSRYSSFCVPTFLFSLAEALVLQLPEYQDTSSFHLVNASCFFFSICLYNFQLVMNRFRFSFKCLVGRHNIFAFYLFFFFSLKRKNKNGNNAQPNI